MPTTWTHWIGCRVFKRHISPIQSKMFKFDESIDVETKRRLLRDLDQNRVSTTDTLIIRQLVGNS